MDDNIIYVPSDVLGQIVKDAHKPFITIKFRQTKQDPNWKELYGFIEDMIKLKLISRWVPMNFREIDDDETRPTMFIDFVRNEPDNIEKYVKEVLLKQDMRIMRKFYDDAIGIANDLNNMHGTHTKEIEKLEEVFHNTYK